MKKVFSILILLISLFTGFNLAIAEEPIKTLDEFLGIPWGASPQEVDQAMLKRNATRVEAMDNGEIIIYSDTFIGKEAQIAFYYFENKMYQAGAFISSPEYQVIDDWKEICDLIAEKYGKPTNKYFYFKSPYSNGDGFETQALQLGKATAAWYWFFPVLKDKEDNVVSCTINTSLTIIIIYQNGELAAEAAAAQKKQKSNDL